VAVDFKLPFLPGGEYLADVWVLEEEGDNIINWGSFAFTVISDLEIESLQLSERLVDTGDMVKGNVKLSRNLKDDETLLLSLWDGLSRKIDEKQLAGEGTSFKFALGPAEGLVIMHEVRAEVLSGQTAVADRRHKFPVRKKKRWDDFSSILWAESRNEYINYLMLEKLREDEADAIDMPHMGYLFRGYAARPDGAFPAETELEVNARNIGMADLRPVPYNYRFGVLGGNENHIARPYCFTDPVWFERVEEAFTIDAEIYGPYGPLAWTHGDESLLSGDPDVCWSPTCLAGFREFLKEMYGDLGALNASWGSDWKNWDEVMPSTYDDARSSGNYPPWLDHKLYMNTVFAGIYDKVCNVLQKGDPGALTGFDGPHGFGLPNGGINWWLLCKTRGLIHSYNDDIQIKVFRSFAPPGTIRGMWYGTYGARGYGAPSFPEFSHYFIWYSLFNQANSVWFWTMGTPGPLSGYAPDLTSLPFFEARTQALHEIKSGIAKLLLSCRRRNDGIAIHYSESSRIAESLFSEKKNDWSNPFVKNLRYTCLLLEACGFQYDFLSYEEIERGKLQEGDFSVLFMPYSRAISPGEAKKIREFVRAGGTVIADIVPGVLDEHGKKQEPGLLRDLFPKDEPLTVTGLGKGKAVLIGDKSRTCDIRSTELLKELTPHINAFRKIMEENTPVTPALSVVPSGPKTGMIPPTTIIRFEGGQVEYAGLLRYYFYNDNKAYPSRVKFGRKSHLYDVRNKKYLGFVDEVETDISYAAHLYALSPYRVAGVDVKTDAGKCKAGQSLEVSVEVLPQDKGITPSKHCIHLKIIGPDNRELKHYARNLLAEEGRCRAQIRFALNDPPGEYSICAEDVASGTSGMLKIVLEQ